MERKHSWTWLPTRLTDLHPADPKPSPKRRPPIPALEQLEDRVLLSTVTTGTGAAGTDAVLIGLLQGQVDLRASEFDWIKLVEGVSTGTQPQADALFKITDAFVKIDTAVSALTSDAVATAGIKFDAPLQKFLEIKLQDVIVSSFATIDKQLGAFGDGSVDKLLPAVQDIQNNTSAFLGTLSQLPAVQFKELGGFIKIQGDLFNADVILDVAVKIHDITITKPIDKASTTLLVKLDTSFQKIDTDIIAVFGDGSAAQGLKSDVDSLKIDAEDILTALFTPTPVGTPTTTALTTTPTTDTIR
jgi:hypothetical protein